MKTEIKTSMSKSKKQLAIIWFIGSGMLFLLMILQTIFGRYGEKVNDAWGWLLPNIMPTLSLIVSVLVMDALGKGIRILIIDSFLFKTALCLSIFYLFILILLILIQPFVLLSPVELMKQSSIYLGPFQGLVSASLGAFFLKREEN